jgi:hypothetical protein
MPTAAQKHTAHIVALVLVYSALIAALWAFPYLPQQDLPAHAGLMALRHRFPTSPLLQQYFLVHESLGSYAVFRAIGEWTYSTLGPIGCVRLFASVPFVATPLALAWMERRLFSRSTFAPLWLGCMLACGFMFVMGFASFLMGLPLWILAATEILVLAHADTAKHKLAAVRLSICAMLLQFIHGYPLLVMAVFGVVVVLPTRSLRRMLHAALAVAPAFAWLLVQVVNTAQSHLPSYTGPLPKQGIVFQGVLDKLSLLVTPTLMTRFGIDALVSIVLWAALCWALYQERATLFAKRALADDVDVITLHRRAFARFAWVAFVLFLLLPHSIGWFGFADGRLLAPILLCAVFALSEARVRAFQAWFAAGSASLAGCLLVATILFQREAQSSVQALNKIPSGARVLNFPFEPNSRYFVGHPFVHYDKLVLLERDIVPSDVWFQVATAVYPSAANPALVLPDTYIESNLINFSIADYQLSDWTHVIARGGQDLSSAELRCEQLPGLWQVCTVIK